ncbi:fatty acid hydroxylase domain-containing protein 2-like, partial [Ruditapes philippinarum]|uniref:fatty acid hydroxylase domain-containing protein 2-like n=1 Tax=Ruditapes philippinarum TaxID=129788 RepID=UPI00295C249D
MGTECITEPSGAKETKGPKSVRLLDSVKKYLFVMGSCLLLFAAARNSFHWQVHRIWGATGSLWQSYWDFIYDKLGRDNDFMFCFAAMWIVSGCVFWLANAFFMVLDITGIPQCIKKYKIQEDVQ